ncbi:MAG: isoaspartyl peptidase/L-asparaginase, partial [Chloroflexia bacterium]|nr:isoaspartyl peptidase/L-asparaginase [Chloroflexia bacterium]
LCTAHSVVTFMRFGLSLDQALRKAVEDLQALDDEYRSEVNIIAIDKDGTHAAASTDPGKTYVYMRDDMDDFIEAGRVHM